MLATEVHEKIQKKAEQTLKNQIEIKSIEIGQYVRQGDVYIRRIENITGTKKIKNRQLAPGITKGSRHIIDDSVNLFKGFISNNPDIPNFIKGPQIEAKKSFTVNHPEHANFILPAGNYQVSYQNDWMRQERVRD